MSAMLWKKLQFKKNKPQNLSLNQISYTEPWYKSFYTVSSYLLLVHDFKLVSINLT